MPKDLRDLLGVSPGSDINIEVVNDEVKLRTPSNSSELIQKFFESPVKLKKKIDLNRILDEELRKWVKNYVRYQKSVC